MKLIETVTSTLSFFLLFWGRLGAIGGSSGADSGQIHQEKVISTVLFLSNID